MNQIEFKQILEELKEINQRLDRIESRLMPDLPRIFRPPEPRPIPKPKPIFPNPLRTDFTFPPIRPIPNLEPEPEEKHYCNHCGREMKNPNWTSEWNSRLGQHENHSKWICSNCDGRSVKLF